MKIKDLEQVLKTIRKKYGNIDILTDRGSPSIVVKERFYPKNYKFDAAESKNGYKGLDVIIS